MNTQVGSSTELPDWEMLRKYIYQLKGVMHVQIVPDDQGIVLEVHVIADRSRSAKQIARDIQSIALARFNLRIDHKVISIAQIDSEENRTPSLNGRLITESFTLAIHPDMAEACVILSYEDDEYEGRVTGMPSLRERNPMIVQATLKAVHQYLENDKIFSLVEVKNIPVADGNAVLVCLSVNVQRKSDLLIGTAFVRDDPQMAVIKATLNAINRRLPMLLV